MDLLKSKKFIIFCLLFITSVVYRFSPVIFSKELKPSSVVFMSVGQGDSAMVRFDNLNYMIVDCGPDNKRVLNSVGKYLPVFKKNIYAVVVTNPDLDHYGGCYDIINNYNVEKLIISGINGRDTAAWERLIAVAIEKNTAIEIIVENKIEWHGTNKLEYLYPDHNLEINPHLVGSTTKKSMSNNNTSIVMLVSGKNKKILFTGDAEAELEEYLAHKYKENLKSDILKVAHHGSKTSSVDKFINQVKPLMSIISVGKNNYGHPSLRVIGRLQKMGSEIFRTDLMGDGIFTF